MDKKQTGNKLSKFYPPVVAVLGHVDHGKTTLLDAIRKTDIAQKEHGGITQKIGASSIETLHEGIKRRITFIDTPGHEAFSKMRSRGAQACDIALLIVSSTEGVMPQTKESIKLLLEAKVLLIVVLTKSDLPGKNIELVKQQLLKEGVKLEGLGGDTPFIEVSAKTGKNIKELLELILLVFDVNASLPRFSERENASFSAIVIESKLDTKAGPKATLVVKNGAVSIKDELVCEGIKARVRALIDENGQSVDQATIGEAVEILGFDEVPNVGGIVSKKSQMPISQKTTPKDQLSPKETGEDSLLLILCADNQGSLEAIVNGLPPEASVISRKTGEITPADIMLAKSTGAILLGFNVKVKTDILKLAQTEEVMFKNYTLIYELLDEIRDALLGKKLALKEEILGQAKVLASFPFEKTKVLGVIVLEGRLAKGDKIRLLKKNEAIGESTISSLRIGKNSVSKVEKNQEAGVLLAPFLDFDINDVLISHR